MERSDTLMIQHLVSVPIWGLFNLTYVDMTFDKLKAQGARFRPHLRII